MTQLRVRYLSMDGLTEGVGVSQVLSYVERLSQRDIHVTLHSFEQTEPKPELRARLRAAGVAWHPHRFGRDGARGGAVRVARAAVWARTGDVVHARSDLAAAAAVVAKSPRWVWDVRSLWADQRIDLGMLRVGSVEERVLRRLEAAAACKSSAIITLTEAVLPVLDLRHGAVSPRATVITTCVDTARFRLAPFPPAEPLLLLLAGTLNRYYDVPAMAALVRELQRRRPARLTVLTPRATPWDHLLADLQPSRSSATPGEMPAAVAASHVGLSICREDVGLSLTAAMPTKLGEFLATGRPVVVNARLGDAAVLVTAHRAGVVVGSGREAVNRAADELEALVADADTPNRCRQLAVSHFDLDRAVDRLADVYRRATQS